MRRNAHLLLQLTILIVFLFQSISYGHKKRHKRSRTKSSQGSFQSRQCAPIKGEPNFTQNDSSNLTQLCTTPNAKGDFPRTKTCIHWTALQAEKAYSSHPTCSKKITAPLLMCIFEREVRDLSSNPCGNNGCGIGQMTSAGAQTVQRGFNIWGLKDEWRDFFNLVNAPQEAQNYCRASRKSALNRNYGIMMTATHLCAQMIGNGTRSLSTLSRDYNGHPRNKFSYSRFVTSCAQRKYKSNSPLADKNLIDLKSECQRYGTCGDKSFGSTNVKPPSRTDNDLAFPEEKSKLLNRKIASLEKKNSRTNQIKSSHSKNRKSHNIKRRHSYNHDIEDDDESYEPYDSYNSSLFGNDTIIVDEGDNFHPWGTY